MVVINTSDDANKKQAVYRFLFFLGISAELSAQGMFGYEIDGRLSVGGEIAPIIPRRDG